MVGGLVFSQPGDHEASLTGLLWAADGLSLATLYFPPRAPLSFRTEGAPGGDVLLARGWDSALSVTAKGASIEVARGDIVVLPCREPMAFSLPEGGRFDCALLPERALGASAGRLSRLMMRSISPSILPLQLLVGYAGYLLRRGAATDDEARTLVAHFYDLLPILADHLLDAEPRSAGGDGRTASVKAFIEARLSDCALSLAAVAKAEGVSERSIQKLFSREGRTFSRYVLERRLERARLLIAQPGQGTPIHQVAYGSGFNDLSYFNRAFRKRYGVRPSDLRDRSPS